MRKYILFTVLFIFSFYAKPLYSQGLLGGEIRWDCVSVGQSNAGKYIFYLKVYQACYNDTTANPVLNSTQILKSISPAGNRSMSIAAGYPKDVSPICSPDTSLPQTNCSSPDSISAFNGAHRVYLYVDTFAVSGTPPPQGWTFSWNGGTRNRSTNLVDSLNPSMRLRSIMYPYGTQNAYPCFDYAPASAESPIVMTCNGYSFNYTSVTRDRELDSLHYEWSLVQDTNISNVSFVANHSYLSPLPNTLDNPNNINATINPYTGWLNLTTYTDGGFFANQKISAYKCGVKVAEIYRDMYFQFYDCGSNVSPTMKAPFKNATSFVDTIYTGDRIVFDIEFADSQYLANSNPQSVSMMAYGSQFGSYIPATGSNPPIFDTTQGCLNPPCASLRSAPSDSLLLHDTTMVNTHFSWQTDCGHIMTNIGCGNTSNIYDFYFKYWDNYCPVPAYNWGSIKIVVLPHPELPPPIFDSLIVNSQNGAASLYWTPLLDSFNIFDSYRIFKSNNHSGPYTLIDTITNLNDSAYTDINANALNQSCFYYITTESKYWCFWHIWSNPSDTLHNYINNLMIQNLSNPFSNNSNVIIKVNNIASADIDSIQFRFMQPDSIWVTEQWKGSIKSGKSLTYTFNTNFQPYNNPSFRLFAYADLINDIDTSDNVVYATDTLGHVDLKLVELYNPYLYPNLKVQVSVKNLGYTSFDTIRFSFKQPNDSIISEIWNGNLTSGNSLTFRFQQGYIPSYHPNYYLCVKAEVLNDIDIINNRRCRSTPLSINESINKGFHLFPNIPNPASETTQIRFNLPQKGQVQLQVYDITGRRIFSQKIVGQNGLNTYKMNISNFEAGVYYYRLVFEGVSLNSKFVVLR